MKVGTGGAPAGSDRPQNLSGADYIPLFHRETGTMKEGAVKAHAMIKDQQVPFQSERLIRGEDNHTPGGRDERCPGPGCSIDTGVIAAGGVAIDALRTEHTRDATGGGPDKMLTPAVRRRIDRSCGRDPCKLAWPARTKLGTGNSAGRRRVDMFDPPFSRQDGEPPFEGGAIVQHRAQGSGRRRIAVESDKEAAVLVHRDRRAVKFQHPRSRWNGAAHQAALPPRAFENEVSAR